MKEWRAEKKNRADAKVETEKKREKGEFENRCSPKKYS